MVFGVLGAMAVFALALLGWGHATRRLFDLPAGHWPVTLALGLAALLFLGGFANALHIAYPMTLAALLLAGLGTLGWTIKRDGWAVLRPPEPTAAGIAVGAAAILILIFTVATQLPPAAYNIADDYGKYFLHPLQMLHSGTVGGNPLSALGSETLGGKAFLDGFIVGVFPVMYLNGTDAVFGLFLCLALTGGLAARQHAVVAGVLAVLAVIVIEPQYINTSALYLGSALMMTAILIAADAEERASPAALGLVYAGLISLKSTFLLFALLHPLCVAAALAIGLRQIKTAARWLGLALAWTLLFLSPWLIVHLPHYLSALTHPVRLADAGYGPVGSLNFFSPTAFDYRGSMLLYTLAVLSTVAAGLYLAVAKHLTPRALLLLAHGAVALIGYVVIVAAMGPLMVGYSDGVRYFTPFVIAVVPLAAILFASECDRRWLALAACALPLVLFAPAFADRFDQAVQDGHILGFRSIAELPLYRDLNRIILGSETAQAVAEWQAQIPQGEPIIAWINAPFLLDLDRNPVVAVESAGLVTPWARLPDKGAVIWEYGGAPNPYLIKDMNATTMAGLHERMIAMQSMALFRQMERMGTKGTLLRNDGQRVAIFTLP